MIYTKHMTLKALLYILAAGAIAFFLYVLIDIRGCCGDAPVEAPVSGEAASQEVPLERSVVSLHFGDLMLGRGVGRSIGRGVDPFSAIKGFINEGGYDLVVANLEGPFTESLECQIKPYSFRFDPEHVRLITSAGINALSLANNHSNDCFRQGIEDTRRILEGSGVAAFGDDSSSIGMERAVWTDASTRTTLLGFDMTLGLQSAHDMGERVEEAHREGLRTVVHIHWGNEYEPLPNSVQRETARMLVEKGADLIIGHHPHVIEPVEMVQGTAVFYSLGNFVFDQDTVETQTGYAVEEQVLLSGEGELLRERYVIHPYRILSHVPTLLEGEERSRVCERVLSLIDESLLDSECSFVKAHY